MQFSAIIVALFAGIALAAPALEARQDSTECTLCRNDCFFSKTDNAAFQSCIQSCNSGLGCNITQ
ncbi:hypothetical protein CGRA01v4_05219 [Colletotrichum graminicola]|uniref:Uncharacterized protein n=1 Tax=Colletotrichum graminicola (strain M1.001 / M2 / FGSC 10212) TaxID=645133 RepID=E3QEY2_COLGM|nr:uncharacterized protein GLRG_04582 [Colletotrichum graminicola M1.001]EFQ29438.1 hypothetical protein GLRG_04582 [Colletotrichum graminicola M1.001]WDK13938.1 hypothetical protein CGRA01v4_05219 [Colletotrichum graminicola]